MMDGIKLRSVVARFSHFVFEGARAVGVARSLLTLRLFDCTFSEAMLKAMMDALRGNTNLRELHV